MPYATTEQPLLLSAAEAASLLGVTERSVHRWIQNGSFPAPEAVRVVGGRTKFSRVVLEDWANGTQPPPGR